MIANGVGGKLEFTQTKNRLLVRTTHCKS